MKRLALLISLALSVPAMADSVPTLAAVPLTLAASQTQPLGDTIDFEVTVTKADELAGHLAAYRGIAVSRLASDKLAITMTAKPEFTGELTARYTQSSFVIDIDEPATQAFINGFPDHGNKNAEINAIANYVSSYITEPTYIHGFNFASKAAATRAGDCTEYAALTTALARALRLSARLVLGTVIVDAEENTGAFGHAWTEVWYQGRWQIIDAALLNVDVKHLYYLPEGALENEGPGFGMSLIAVNMRMPHRFDNVQSVK